MNNEPKRNEDLFLSIVIPVRDEEENLTPLYRGIIETLTGKYRDFEIIFIDDGSVDNTLRVLKSLHEKDRRVKIIEFRRNFGQSAALSAGFACCKGDVIVTLDGDMQNDPADIPGFVDIILKGFDMVNGWRKDRKDKLFSRRIPSFLGNKLISFITKVKLHDYGCSLRAFTRDTAKDLTLYGEMHRYIPAIASRMGVKSVEIAVNHRERRFSKSKYGLGRTFRLLLDLISIKYLLTFSYRPLHIFSGLGFILMGLGFLSGAYLTYLKFALDQSIGSRPLLFFTVLAIGLGFQFLTLGLVAEMLTRIYHESLQKNVYFVRSYTGFDNPPGETAPPSPFKG
jgi:glycosyltransferase involved in cell wall biosynthesis